MIPITPVEAIDLAILLGVPVLVVRLVVGLSRPRRVSRFWTFALPTGALLAFLLRVSITRNLEDVIPADDWIAAASWWGVVATQGLATGYQWLPEVLYGRWFTRRRTTTT